MSIRRLLIDYDCLQDTRLGVIRNIDEDIVVHLVKNDDYWLRDNDNWEKLTGGRLTNEQFQEAYAARGGENTHLTLNASFETGIFPFIMHLLVEADIIQQNNLTAFNDELGLAINIWPYVLNFQQKQELIQITREKYGSELHVVVESHSPEQLTPEFMYGLYGGYLCYSYQDWVKLHYRDLALARMPDFNFIHPKLFEKDVEHLDIEQRKWELLRFRADWQSMMDFDYIDSKWFSLVRIDTNPPE
jgi:hypothetical protein